MPKTIQSYLFTTIIFLGSFVLIWYLLGFPLYEIGFMPPRLSDPSTSLYALITFFVPLFGGLGLARLFAKWYNRKNKIETPWIPKKKSVRCLIFALYLLTAFVGSPTVENQNIKRTIGQFNRMTQGKMPCDDYIYRSYFRIPVLPFITLGYSDYSLNYLEVWGGWEVHVWYFVGAKRLFYFPVWYS